MRQWVAVSSVDTVETTSPASSDRPVLDAAINRSSPVSRWQDFSFDLYRGIADDRFRAKIRTAVPMYEATRRGAKWTLFGLSCWTISAEELINLLDTGSALIC
ncbi:hypothetical protein ACI2KT_36630 [Ensifer adhaerens]|uniref:hypothetical protein n=1 Tax=Ensifer adhaerens TaxID=106592 RepID=UPI0038512E68